MRRTGHQSGGLVQPSWLIQAIKAIRNRFVEFTRAFIRLSALVAATHHHS